MPEYPSHERYAALYSRFLTKGVDYLIDLAELEPMDRVLDLCCGSGRLSKRAWEREDLDAIVMVDECKDMPDHSLWEDVPEDKPPVDRRLRIESVDLFLADWAGCRRFNVVFCQQAVNYWINPLTVEMVSQVMEPGGRFVFNTFGNKPASTPTWKDYPIEGAGEPHLAVELYYVTYDNMVHHVMARTGYEPHVTKFPWITEHQFREMLEPFFIVTTVYDGKSTNYVCTKKGRR